MTLYSYLQYCNRGNNLDGLLLDDLEDFDLELLPEFQLILDRSKMKIGELLVSKNIITNDELENKLVSQSRIEKFTGIKPRILDLVYGINFEGKIGFLDDNNIKLLLGEKLIRDGLITDKQLFNILKLQNNLKSNGQNLLFGELLLRETKYDERVLDFLVKNSYLKFEEIEITESCSF
ncbi:MAG: hypothetical protein PHS49_06240 [Candidatus Gracilibacteria bacterium]|nr:hypothetical protein [Candidatus Gracilibacteria bacterium]